MSQLSARHGLFKPNETHALTYIRSTMHGIQYRYLFTWKLLRLDLTTLAVFVELALPYSVEHQ